MNRVRNFFNVILKYWIIITTLSSVTTGIVVFTIKWGIAVNTNIILLKKEDKQLKENFCDKLNIFTDQNTKDHKVIADQNIKDHEELKNNQKDLSKLVTRFMFESRKHNQE